MMAVLATAGAYAQQAILTGDTQINSAAPAAGYGSTTTVNVSPTNSGLLLFDLSTLPAGTTAAQVLQARLILFPDLVTTGGTVGIYKVTSAWSEGATTYANKPTIAASADVTASVGVAGTFHSVSILDLVQSWVTTPSTNHGVELKANGSANITFDSKENTATSHPAVLEVVLSSPAGPVGPTGPKGATGAAGPAGPSETVTKLATQSGAGNFR
jgi:hypothetical protein